MRSDWAKKHWSKDAQRAFLALTSSECEQRGDSLGVNNGKHAAVEMDQGKD